MGGIPPTHITDTDVKDPIDGEPVAAVSASAEDVQPERTIAAFTVLEWLEKLGVNIRALVDRLQGVAEKYPDGSIPLIDIHDTLITEFSSEHIAKAKDVIVAELLEFARTLKFTGKHDDVYFA